MKNIRSYFILIIIFLTNLTNAQQLSDNEGKAVDSAQVKTALKFIRYFAKDDVENAWKLFDKAKFPKITKADFSKGIKQVYQELSLFDDYKLNMAGIKIVENKEVKFYSFRALSNKNVVDDVNINVFFYKGSKLVAGIQPEKKLKETSASTTKAKETEIEKSFTAKIDGKEYSIKGINIVHFENNQGLLAIQVEYPSQKNNSVYNTEATKFARYLLNNGYIQKASIKAAEEKLELLEDIGVSFFDSKENAGFNVMVKPAEYK